MRALLVDDEKLARLELARLLSGQGGVTVVGEAPDLDAAARLVAERRPDVVFLDVSLAGEDGFDLLDRLEPPVPAVVFVTAYGEHALRAFEVNALDYITKPVVPERLAAALAKIAAARPAPPQAAATATTVDEAEGADDAASPGGPLALTDRVYLRDGDRCWFTPLAAIRLLESEGNHTRVHLERDAPLLPRSLVSLEPRLPPAFVRANRTQILNIEHLLRVEPWFSGSIKAVLAGGLEVEFSRRHAQEFRRLRAL